MNCLDELFQNVDHLNFINPIISPSSTSIGGEVSRSVPGKSFLKIRLPFSSTSAVCEYSLMTQPKNYYQLYRVSPSMFFSVFSDVIESRSIPGSCSGVLEPPNIAHKHLGNADGISRTLNGYFNSDGTTQISHKNIIVNGLELQESITNFPSNNPYEIFGSPSLCGKLAECLAPNKVIEHLYDCNSHLTLWAGRHHCPEVCRHRPGSGTKPIHLCSRVVNCGEGVFLGFRGGKMLGSERSLAEEFAPYVMLNQMSSPAYYSAFQLKHVDGWSANLKKPFRFAVFLSASAKSSFLNLNPNIPNIPNPISTSASIQSSLNSLAKKQLVTSTHSS